MKSTSSSKPDKKMKPTEFQQLKFLFTKEASLNKERFKQIDKRFEQVDKRLDGIDNHLDGIDNHLDGIDNRLDGHDKKFYDHEKKFDEVNDRLLTYLDKIFGAIQDLRTENAASTYLFDDHQKTLKDHEERIVSLEEKVI
jgi:peptidoglycan hydrolase CwlO-like protein